MLDLLFRDYDRVIFFDTETTGFDADKNDQIIELAAIAVDRDGKQEEMDEFIHLETMQELPSKIIELTGINDIILASQGIDERDAIEKFVRLMEPGTGTLLAAHNAQFDLLFMAYAIHRYKDYGKGWMKVFTDCDYLDTLTVYRDRYRYPHKLQDAITEYGLAGKVENSHRAVDDCKALFEVAKRMEEEKDDLNRYVNIFGYNPRYGPSGRMFKKVWYGKQGFDAHTKPPLYTLRPTD